MKVSLVAGFFYFLIVGAAGVVMGALREVFVSPVLGRGLAVVLELPLMLGLAFVACRWLVKVNDVPDKLVLRLVMGVSAFIALQTMEQGLRLSLQYFVVPQAGVLAWGWSDYVGLAGQVAFGLLPLFITTDSPQMP